MRNQNHLEKVIISVLFIFVFTISGIGQTISECDYHRPQQADNWVFGDNVRLNFMDLNNIQQIPGEYYGSGTKEAPVGVSSISDEEGNLLLYTNGMHIWDAESNIISSNLDGYNAASMTSLIVPTPGNSNRYYIFTVDLFVENVFTSGVNFTIVEWTNNSWWKTIAKNIPLLTENAQKICAVKHGNGRDYWIITHGLGPNKGSNFYVNLLSDSLDVFSQSYSVGIPQTYDPNIFNTYNNGGGYLKASPDGSKLAQAIFHDGYVETFDFDNETGIISNAMSSDLGVYSGPFGIEFSPDATKLYITTSPLGNAPNFLYQVDLIQQDGLNNPFELDRLEILPDEQVLFGALQMATDGKIYVNKYLKGISPYPELSVIYNPNRLGESCNYNMLDGNSNSQLYLEHGNSLDGLPVFPSDFLDIPHFFYNSQCLNDTTNFIIRNTANLEPSWNFNDPSGVDITFDPMNPRFVFSESGTYSVVLTESYNGENYVFTEDIIINPLPTINIGNESGIIYILPGSSIRLDAGENMDMYLWHPSGSTSRYLDVNEEGFYSATITDFNCCTNTDTVEVRFATLSFPNAIRPGSAIPENQTFNVIGNTSAIAQYQLQIFNRWGQIIFETDDPDIGWDGTQEGSPVPTGTYVYAAVFTSFESGIQSSIDIKNRGTVTVLR